MAEGPPECVVKISHVDACNLVFRLTRVCHWIGGREPKIPLDDRDAAALDEILELLREIRDQARRSEKADRAVGLR